MSRLIGSPAYVDPEQVQDLGYSPSEVGSYLFRPTGPAKRRSELRYITVPGTCCPYCRGPLKRLDPRDGVSTGRVIAIASEQRGRVDVVIDPLPDAMWAVACGRCKANFVVPKRKRKSDG